MRVSREQELAIEETKNCNLEKAIRLTIELDLFSQLEVGGESIRTNRHIMKY